MIVDLPDHENDQFQLVTYGLFALKHLHNNGLKFNGFRVPAREPAPAGAGRRADDRLPRPEPGPSGLVRDGGGLDAGDARQPAPLGTFRRTYGAAIVTRELVLRRIGRLAALIVGCDALVDWCSWLLDQGYRGELECIIAKIFGSEAQKEAAIELFMKTHGGRAFLHGHLFGENVHEYLAPCIYEGEGEMLGMAFFKSLIKEHGKTFFEPIGRALAGRGHQQAESAQPGPRLGAQGRARAVREVAARRDAHAAAATAPRRRRRFRPPWPRMPSSPPPASQRSRLEISNADVQAPAPPGRPPVPDGRAFAAHPGPGRDARDQPLGRPAVERDRAGRGRQSSAAT